MAAADGWLRFDGQPLGGNRCARPISAGRGTGNCGVTHPLDLLCIPSAELCWARSAHRDEAELFMYSINDSLSVDRGGLHMPKRSQGSPTLPELRHLLDVVT